jgi:hypothetical protein
MAQVVIRANLSSVQIPLLTEEFGRSVIVRQQDLNYVPTVTSKADVDKDVGIPQIFYAHNVMPTYYGYRSLAFSNQIPAASPAALTFKQVFNLLSVSGDKVFLAANSDGSLYVCTLATSYIWSPISNFYKAVITEGTNTGDGYVVSAQVLSGAGADVYVATFTSATAFNVTKNGSADGSGTTATEYISANGKVKLTINSGLTPFISGDNFTLTLSAASFNLAITSAALSGETYICSEGSGIFQYDFTTNSLVWRLAAGLDATGILGITASNGYLITYSIDTVAWSSTIDPLDFVPSLSTGAGSGSVEDAKGPIRRCVGLTSGFVVFTAANAVAAIFGQNLRYPFTFREIPNAGGISDLSLVTEEADSTSVYAFTTYGFQQISTLKATSVMPELGDFLTGKRFEDMDAVTLQLTQTNLTAPIKKQVQFISGRYLVISYGIDSFTHALVYDTAIQRFGKLKHKHVTVFQYGFLDADDADTPRKQLAMMQEDGTVLTVEYAAGIAAEDSLLILGKFQYIRSRHMQLDAVELESVDPADDLDVYDLQTLDGKTFEPPVAGYVMPYLGLSRRYNFRLSAQNHSILVKGTFKLDSMQITFNVHGKR